MAHSHDIGLGLVWFTGDLACYVFDCERLEGEPMTRPQGLLSDHRYLTNLSYEKHTQFLEDHPELTGLLFMDGTMVVGTNTLAEEIGMPRFEQTQEPKRFQELLATLYHTYLHTCKRLGLDPLGIDFTLKGVREDVFYRTTNGAMRAVTTAEVKEGLSIKPHRWVNTGVALPEGAYRRRLTISRDKLYGPLLKAATPVGDWEEGEPNTSVDAILAMRTETHDVLIRGRLSDLPRTGFPDPVATDEVRRYFTGEELDLIVQAGREMEILNWWHGEIDAPPAMPETNSLSLVDDVIYEIMHRSWRENRGTGFWHSVAERIRLQRLAYQMHMSGIPVLGYGSGKVVIATPEDRDDPTARHEQDALLLRKFGQYGIQPPLEHLLDHPELGTLAEHLSDLQAISLAGPTFLRRIDEAITEGEEDAYISTINDADGALHELVTRLSSSERAPAAVVEDQAESPAAETTASSIEAAETGADVEPSTPSEDAAADATEPESEPASNAGEPDQGSEQVPSAITQVAEQTLEGDHQEQDIELEVGLEADMDADGLAEVVIDGVPEDDFDFSDIPEDLFDTTEADEDKQ